MLQRSRIDRHTEGLGSSLHQWWQRCSNGPTSWFKCYDFHKDATFSLLFCSLIIGLIIFYLTVYGGERYKIGLQTID